MARLALFAMLLLVSLAARADDAGDPWAAFQSDETALLRSLAGADAAIPTASAEDCAQACKALESLARAAAHICDIAPEHCSEARQRLANATARVRAACPQCEAQPATTAAGQRMEVYAAESRRGGCAGCTADDGEHSWTPWLGLAVWVVARRRRSTTSGRRRPSSARRSPT